MAVALVFLLKSMNKQFRKIAPKAEETTGLEAVKGSKPGQSETSAQDAPK